MPIIPLSPLGLAWIAIGMLVPGLVLGAGSAASRRPMSMRQITAVLVGAVAGWLLGTSTLASEMPLPECVPVLFLAVGLGAEGIAGRGRPCAGIVASALYLASLVLDFLDRNGNRASPVLWGVIAAISLLFGMAEQGVWRMVWNRLPRGGSPAPAEP